MLNTSNHFAHAATQTNLPQNSAQQQNPRGFAHLTLSDTVKDIAKNPAFNGFGDRLLTRDDNRSIYDVPLSRIGSLMPYHSHVIPNVVLNAVNRLIDDVNQGETVFYDIYSPQQKQQDPDKANTGLIFYRGKVGAPFAVISPGGGFAYVGSLHEGFPIAQKISEQGLNAFVIRYRIGSEREATEDLAAAIKFIMNNAEMLGVSKDDYSIWGGSAGARMVGDIALNGLSSYGVDHIAQPSTAVIIYTGQYTYSNRFPATFMAVSENDRIASARVMESRAENLRKVGVKVEFHKYKSASHGFGTGEGTDAEGWIDNAVQFWRKQIND